MCNKTLKYIIPLVWFLNGFFCKILNLVPIHQKIVARILIEEYSLEITFSIGVLETVMVFWILSYYKSKLNAITQIITISLMNIIEFFLAKDLLLFGQLNIVFALIFCGLIYYNEFEVKKTTLCLKN